MLCQDSAPAAGAGQPGSAVLLALGFELVHNIIISLSISNNTSICLFRKVIKQYVLLLPCFSFKIVYHWRSAGARPGSACFGNSESPLVGTLVSYGGRNPGFVIFRLRAFAE